MNPFRTDENAAALAPQRAAAFVSQFGVQPIHAHKHEDNPT